MIKNLINYLTKDKYEKLYYDKKLSNAFLQYSVCQGNLNGKITAIVGAYGGLGSSLAYRFALEGSNLILLGRDKLKLEILKKDIEKNSRVSVVCVSIDCMNEESIETAISEVLESYCVDYWINSQGVFKQYDAKKEFRTVTKSQFNESFQVNYESIKSIVKYIYVKSFLIKSHLTIINIGSICSKSPRFQYTPYGMSKRALNYLAQEFAFYDPKCSVFTILPGSIATKMNGTKYGDNISRKCGILSRPLLPEEVAACIAFIASLPYECTNANEFILSGGEEL